MRSQTLFILVAIVAPLWASVAQAANPEHITQLLTTKECNACDLSGADLVGADLAGAKLEGANLNAANLTGTDLTGANLTRASLAGGNLVGANLQRANLNETSFVYANLALVQLNNAVLNKTDLQAANLMGADFLGARVTKSSFVAANLASTKNSKFLYLTTYGNIFQGEIKVGLGRSTTSVEKPVSDTSTTFESGGSPSAATRVLRRYRIPLWIGRPVRSTAGATWLHNPGNPDLLIEIW
jgi:hypothetical protein